MPETKLKEGTRVFTADGKEAGKIDPKTRETTHIAIQKGWLLTEDKVVLDEVHLTVSAGTLEALPSYE